MDCCCGARRFAVTAVHATPFAVIPEWVLLADVSDRAIRIYGILRRHADGGGRNAYPGRKRLAELAHTSVDSVKRAIKELVSIGAVTVVPRFDPGGQTSNEYWLAADPPVHSCTAPPVHPCTANESPYEREGSSGKDAAMRRRNPSNQETPLFDAPAVKKTPSPVAIAIRAYYRGWARTHGDARPLGSLKGQMMRGIKNAVESGTPLSIVETAAERAGADGWRVIAFEKFVGELVARQATFDAANALFEANQRGL